MLADGRIKRVRLNSAGLTNGGRPAQNVQLYLSNGTILSFLVHEIPSGGDYAVSMAITRPGRGTYFTDVPISEQKHAREPK